jgi:hypothetical protein
MLSNSSDRKTACLLLLCKKISFFEFMTKTRTALCNKPRVKHSPLGLTPITLSLLPTQSSSSSSSNQNKAHSRTCSYDTLEIISLLLFLGGEKNRIGTGEQNIMLLAQLIPERNKHRYLTYNMIFEIPRAIEDTLRNNSKKARAQLLFEKLKG